MATTRPSAHCPRCGFKLISPKWSESVGTDDSVNLWRCPICGHDFATTENGVAQTPADAELIEDWL